MKYYRNLYKSLFDFKVKLILNDGTEVIATTNEDANKLHNGSIHNPNITINGITFKPTDIIDIYFGNNWDITELKNYFCYYFTSLTHLDPLPDMITSIDGYFMFNCKSFNSSITLPSSLTSIGNTFMSGCTSFNQTITIPESVTSIGNTFMSGCTSFNQTITIPESVTSIGSKFMRDCTSFNQPLTLPSSITSIGNDFMYRCDNFIGPLEILFTDPNIFDNSYTNILTVITSSRPAYVIGVTITGNMTGIQFKTRFPNTSSYQKYRNILD